MRFTTSNISDFCLLLYFHAPHKQYDTAHAPNFSLLRIKCNVQARSQIIGKDDRCFVQSIHTQLDSYQADFYYIL
jgi:hypothetical protein